MVAVPGSVRLFPLLNELSSNEVDQCALPKVEKEGLDIGEHGVQAITL